MCEFIICLVVGAAAIVLLALAFGAWTAGYPEDIGGDLPAPRWGERSRSWILMRLPVFLALVAGVFITVAGYVHPSPWTRSLVDRAIGSAHFYEHWAPHFGPELLILALAALFVDAAQSRRERRTAIRFRTVQAFMHLLSYGLEREVCFFAGNLFHLELERDAIGRRAEARRRALWSDEKILLKRTEDAARAFVNAALDEGSIRHRLGQIASDRQRQTASGSLNGGWAVALSLGDQVTQAMSWLPRKNGNAPIEIESLVEHGMLVRWEEDWLDLLAQADLTAHADLQSYFDLQQSALDARAALLNAFYDYRLAALNLRDRIWEGTDPDG